MRNVAFMILGLTMFISGVFLRTDLVGTALNVVGLLAIIIGIIGVGLAAFSLSQKR
jgi:hypothetical protein